MSEYHFDGDFAEAMTCARKVISLVRAGDYTSKALYDHVFNACGELNALRGDEPGPVFALTQPSTVDECCDHLESLLPANGEQPMVAGPSPADVWQILQVLYHLFTMIIKIEANCAIFVCNYYIVPVDAVWPNQGRNQWTKNG